MNAAVTGASGFLGLHLVRELRASGADVTAVVRPTSNIQHLSGGRIARATLESTADLADAFAGCDTVFHLAGAVDFGNDWDRVRRINVDGTRKVILAATRAGVRRVVHCSSIIAVGAARQPIPFDEGSKWNLGPLKIAYATTKWEAEQLALAANSPNLEVVVANPSCAIGPDDFAGSEFGTMCRRFWRGRIPIHFGGGNNFVDARDAAIGLRLCAENGRPGERYILGGTNLSMSAFFSALARSSGRAIPRLRVPTALSPFVAFLDSKRRSEKPPYLTPAQAKLSSYFFYFDCAKARRELGYSPRPLDETLRDAYAFWEPSRAAA